MWITSTVLCNQARLLNEIDKFINNLNTGDIRTLEQAIDEVLNNLKLRWFIYHSQNNKQARTAAEEIKEFIDAITQSNNASFDLCRFVKSYNRISIKGPLILIQPDNLLRKV